MSNQSNSGAAKRGNGRISRGAGIYKLLTTPAPCFILVAVVFVFIITYFHYTDEFNEGDLFGYCWGCLMVN